MESVETGGAALVNAMRAAAKRAPCDALPLYFHKLTPRAANPAALREDLGAKLWRYSADAIAQLPPAPPAVEVSHAASA